MSKCLRKNELWEEHLSKKHEHEFNIDELYFPDGFIYRKDK